MYIFELVRVGGEVESGTAKMVMAEQVTLSFKHHSSVTSWRLHTALHTVYGGYLEIIKAACYPHVLESGQCLGRAVGPALYGRPPELGERGKFHCRKDESMVKSSLCIRAHTVDLVEWVSLPV